MYDILESQMLSSIHSYLTLATYMRNQPNIDHFKTKSIKKEY